jgi:CHRD domain-containing protein
LSALVLDVHWEKIMTSTAFIPLVLITTLACGPACADKFKATLDGKSEVPATTSSGSGTADIDYDPASKKLSWKLTYSGLTGPATAAHFHGPAEPGKNAGVAVAIPNATSSPTEGSATLTDAQAADLEGGKYYINVHTAANPAGEIRGQVTK